MVPGPNLSELQTDALREVANIGSGNAVTALSSKLSGRLILSQPPRSRMAVPGVLADLAGAGDDLLSIASFSLAGGVTGDLLCIFQAPFADELLGSTDGESSETAAIVGSAYVDGVAAFTHLSITSELRKVERGRAADLDVGWWGRPGVERTGLILATQFMGDPRQDRPELSGSLVFAPSLSGVAALLAALHLSA